jgi:DNA-binding MarR family transcriptional regulator
MNRLNWMFYHHIQHINHYKQWFTGQGKILAILLENKDMSQNKLLEIVGIKAPSLSEALNKMEKQKLIKRKNNPKDGRANIISLTLRGKQYAERSKKMSEHHSDKMFESLTEDEKEQLMTILEKLHKNAGDDMHVHFRGRHFHNHRHKEHEKDGEKNKS